MYLTELNPGPTIPIQALPAIGSLYHCHTHSFWLTLADSGSVWLSLALSGLLWLTLALSLALSGTHWLIESLLGLLGLSCVAPVYPALSTKHLRGGQGLDSIMSELKFTFQDSGQRGKRTQWAKVQKYTHVKVSLLLEQLQVSVLTFQTTESS